MADHHSHMHSVKKKSVTSDAKNTEETSMPNSSSSSAIPSNSHHLTEQEDPVLFTVAASSSSDVDRSCDDKLNTEATASARVNLDEDDENGVIKTQPRVSPSDDDDEYWVDIPASLRLPWRANDLQDRRYRQRMELRAMDHTLFDSDSDSSGSGRMFPNNLDDDDFEDVVSELGLGAWREWLHLDDNPDHHRERPQGPPEEPLYPQGVMVETECYICFEETSLRRRLCCDFPVCDPCLESYLTVQVTQANVNIECLNISCSSYIQRSEISARLPTKMKMKFYKFLIDANINPTVKTCPRCSTGLQVEKATLKKRKVIKNGLAVVCQRCGLEWCFFCHAPWHKGLTCKEFRKGDALLKDWAKEFHYGQMNAQKCPKCKIFIQRSLGCDHMTCSRCDTSFCYRCGEHYRGCKLLGNHFSRYSPFGCRYNFMPDAPHLRRLIRGAVLGGKLVGGLALSGFVVAAGAVLLGISVIALPAWGSYKLHKRRKYRQRLRANRKYAKHNLALRNLQAKKATESSVPVLPVPPMDLSDSTVDYDDSSDENRDRIILGLQLPDSQRVEVLVHRAVSSYSDQEEGVANGAGREVVTESAVILTDVKEVVNEDGYTTVVANIYAKCPDKDVTVDSATEADESDPSDDSDEEYVMDSVAFSTAGKVSLDPAPEKGKTDSGKENQSGRSCQSRSTEVVGDSDRNRSVFTVNTPMKPTEGESTAPLNSATKCHQTKERQEREADQPLEKKSNETDAERDRTEKHAEDGEKNEKKQKEAVSNSEKKEKQTDSAEKNVKRQREKDKESGVNCKPADQHGTDQLSKESSNGCFGNIFSRKLTVIQISGRRNTVPQSEGQKAGSVCIKSATWEKSHEKSHSHKPKTSMDIRDLSHFNEKLPCQDSDSLVGNGLEKGILLQDCVVLSPPGDFKSDDVREEDSLSLSSALSFGEGGGLREEGEEAGEQESGCLSASDSFRGSNLSCDIVTYL